VYVWMIDGGMAALEGRHVETALALSAGRWDGCTVVHPCNQAPWDTRVRRTVRRWSTPCWVLRVMAH
jgi:hypothetical protein